MIEYGEALQSQENNLPLLEKLAKEQLDLSEAVQGTLETALAQIECAVIEARQGLLVQANRRIKKAINLFDTNRPSDEASKQTYAAAYWLLGCLDIYLGKTRAAVLKNWQVALTLYEKLAQHPLMVNTSRYTHITKRMRSEIKEFVSDREYVAKYTNTPPLINFKGTTVIDSSEQPALPTLSRFQPAALVNNQFEMLEVFHNIPAGPLLEVEDPPEALAKIPLSAGQSTFEFDGLDYQLYHLGDEQQLIRLNKQQRYIVLKVQGDSMNLANIDHGDYILLRLQNSAEPRDIVAAQLVLDGEAPKATLKRFERNGKQIYLKAESSNPKNQSYIIDEKDLNQQVSITGVAIGVFKPANTWTSAD